MAIELTEFQKDVLARMRKKGMDFISAVTEEHWTKGEAYYIDTRVNAGQKLRRDFELGNREAVAAAAKAAAS
jgi:indole-3-glycerol phosphate synthase